MTGHTRLDRRGVLGELILIHNIIHDALRVRAADRQGEGPIAENRGEEERAEAPRGTWP